MGAGTSEHPLLQSVNTPAETVESRIAAEAHPGGVITALLLGDNVLHDLLYRNWFVALGEKGFDQIGDSHVARPVPVTPVLMPPLLHAVGAGSSIDEEVLILGQPGVDG